MVLDEILAQKKKEVRQAKEKVSGEEIITKTVGLPRRRDFKSAIAKPGQISLIAEIKKASPTRGIIREDFDPVEIARIYQDSGAQALSVLTDEQFFKGSLQYLEQVRKVVAIPILRKDFIIDDYQIYQSFLAGADAVLLIAAVLSKDKIASLSSIADGLGMSSIVEIHSAEDLSKIEKLNIQIVGINNRDLTSFKTDFGATERLIKLLPKDKVIISESGIKTSQDVKRLKNLGVKAVLIGEVFMASADISGKIKEIMRGVCRSGQD